MELNREQIVKDLEACCAEEKDCERCSRNHAPTDRLCIIDLIHDAIALIRDLTESLDRVQKQCGEIIVECDERDAERLKQVAKLTEENERLMTELSVKKKLLVKASDLVEHIQADTVRNMQERLKARYKLPQSNEVSSISPFQLHECIDQIAEELLEEAK